MTAKIYDQSDLTTETSKTSTTSAPLFRLLDLPVELQCVIFQHCLGGTYDITLEYERLTMLRSRFHVIGCPPTTLLLTSKHINKYATPIRQGLFTGRLILNSVFILVPIRRLERFQWLRTNTRILHFSDRSVHPERWSHYYDSFENLKRLEIDFPRTVKINSCPLHDVLDGTRDHLLFEPLDAFQVALVKSSSSGKFEVFVKQRYCLKEAEDLWSGVVEVDIRIGEHGLQVIKRKHIPEEQPEHEEITRRAAELVHVNGNVIDQGSHRSLFEWYQAMSLG